MTPAVTPDYFLRFWHLDDLRGGNNVDRSLHPARTVAEVQLAVATGRVISAAVSTMTQALPNALIRTVPLRDGPMSTIAVARERADHRQVVRDSSSLPWPARDGNRAAPRRDLAVLTSAIASALVA